MRTLKSLVFAPALLVALACSKDKPADSALNNDLSLAAQARPGTRLDSITAAERMNGVAPANGYAAPAPVAVAPAPAPAPRRTATASAPARRRTSTRSSSGGSGSSSGSRVVYSEPRTVTVKNTKRDAVIGAAAGAAIGAATGRSVKSGIIGAAVGGILGGVIGNNVDVHKKPAP